MRLLFFGRKRPAAPASPLPQGFDVSVNLRKGDKVVRRNRRGDVEIVCVTTDVTQLDVRGDGVKGRAGA
ncbi:MAG: hypothetical protein HYU41_13675 [Candidatus Rokubacteria bacterium]|nr:hypothetical protein [Candidatus Rokubacteria bacterium]